MENNALKIHESDNVVIATQNVKKGGNVVVNGEPLCEALEDVEAGHKIALVALASGAEVYRYGEPIVETTRAIKRGEWIHVHNTQPIAGELKE